jgi:transposase-like protein
MKRSGFSEEQIIGILKEQEAGMATAEVCRRHGISPATFYNWKSKFGGLEASAPAASPAAAAEQLHDKEQNYRTNRRVHDAVD